jgi:hypothetical protein
MTERCSTCRQRKHPSLSRLAMQQAIHAPPSRPWWTHIAARVLSILAVLALLAQAGSM